MATAKLPLSLVLSRLVYRTLGPLMPRTFGHRAYETWFSTTRFKIPQREYPVMQSAQRQVVDVFGSPVMSYSWEPETAASETVLFIHGWSGRGTQVHAFVEPLLAAGYRVVSFDGPAHGESPGKQTSVLQLADTLLVLQQALGPFAGVITHSFGGMALAFAARHGFTARRAVCICPPDSLETLFNNFCKILALPPSVQQAMLDKLRSSHGNIMGVMINTVHNASQASFPALIIHDRDDLEIPWHAGERIAQSWAGGDFMLTTGLGHHRILRDEVVVQASVDFLQAGD